MNKVNINYMTFSPDDYQNKKELMWADISKFLEILMRNRNICTIKEEDFGAIVINYEHHDIGEIYWGCDQPIWLTEEEQEIIDNHRKAEKEE